MPDLSLIVPLAQMFNVTIDELFGIGAETYDELYINNIKSKVKAILNAEKDADVINKVMHSLCRRLW